MTTTHPCESCSMPIETGRYCQHCVDETGQLQAFEVRFERMISWQQRRTPDASRAFVLLRDDAASIRVAQRIALGSFIVDDFPLGSPSLVIAVLSDSKRMFVSQVHPEGRISFIHWETGAVESVTGFELNGRIVQ